jgi:hypothetical protein
MLTQLTATKLREMYLYGMAEALEEQMEHPAVNEKLSFEAQPARRPGAHLPPVKAQTPPHFTWLSFFAGTQPRMWGLG